jgi:hypothetical protein
MGTRAQIAVEKSFKSFRLLNSNEEKIEQACAGFFKANPTLAAVHIRWDEGKPTVTGAYTKSNFDVPNKTLMKRVAASDMTPLGAVSFDDDVDGDATVYRNQIKGHDTSVLIW